ncbi:MAG: DUF3761 domain-containing protein [Sphingomonas sp.]
MGPSFAILAVLMTSASPAYPRSMPRHHHARHTGKSGVPARRKHPLARSVHHAVSRVLDGSLFGGAYYTNSRGHRVHRPIYQDRRPAGASAQCWDGSWSFGESHRGTCSHHGGVQRWL